MAVGDRRGRSHRRGPGHDVVDTARQFIAQADIPTVAPGVDVLAGIARSAGAHPRIRLSTGCFRGQPGPTTTPAPGGHNGCDTRNDILDRDLVDKTYVSIKRCPNAVATGTLHDPYTNAVVAFMRGNQVGASVQIDHIVPLALAWDLGARNWTDELRLDSPTIPRTCWPSRVRPTRTRAITNRPCGCHRTRCSDASTRCSSSRCSAVTRCRSTRPRRRCCATRPRRARSADARRRPPATAIASMSWKALRLRNPLARPGSSRLRTWRRNSSSR